MSSPKIIPIMNVCPNISETNIPRENGGVGDNVSKAASFSDGD